MDKAKVHVYCGTGQGKTASALGQGIHEASQGKSVIIIQFLKEINVEEYQFFRRLEPEIKVFRFEKSPDSFDSLSKEERTEERQNLKNGLNFAKKVLATNMCDVLILDEVMGLVENEVATVEEIETILNARNEETEVILTGINKGRELWNDVDEVTELVTIHKRS